MNTTTETVLKDFLGQPLHVGDMVVLIQYNYRQFTTGRVTKLHPGSVSVTTEGGARTIRGSLAVVKVPQ